MRGKKTKPSDDLSAAERFQELNTRDVANYIGVKSTKTVWVYVKEGRLPKPRYIKPHQPLWRLGEVLDHTHGLMTTYDEAPRGFAGDTETQSGETGNTGDKLRERLFGRKAG